MFCYNNKWQLKFIVLAGISISLAYGKAKEVKAAEASLVGEAAALMGDQKNTMLPEEISASLGIEEVSQTLAAQLEDLFEASSVSLAERLKMISFLGAVGLSAGALFGQYLEYSIALICSDTGAFQSALNKSYAGGLMGLLILSAFELYPEEYSPKKFMISKAVKGLPKDFSLSQESLGALKKAYLSIKKEEKNDAIMNAIGSLARLFTILFLWNEGKSLLKDLEYGKYDLSKVNLFLPKSYWSNAEVVKYCKKAEVLKGFCRQKISVFIGFLLFERFMARFQKDRSEKFMNEQVLPLLFKDNLKLHSNKQ